MFINKKTLKGFTLIELMVAISIIAILTAIIMSSFDQAREQARDKVRKADLKILQLAVESYKAQNDVYPSAGCSVSSTNFAGPGPGSGSQASCDNYIDGLVPSFLPELPTDPTSEDVANQGFYYRSDGNSYKIMVLDSVESDEVSLGDEFARCPSASGACSGGIPAKTYSVYSVGAENW